MADTLMPSPEQAFDTLYGRVYQELFLRKMAAAGYPPDSEAAFHSQLELAAKLRQLGQSEAVKAAEAADDPYVAANAAFDVWAQANGLPFGKNASVQEASAIQDIAGDLAQDPDLFNSVLAVKFAQAREYARQTQAA